MIDRKPLKLIALTGVTVAVFGYAWYYIFNTADYTVEYKNTNKVEVVDSSGSSVWKVERSGDSKRLPLGTYYVSYEGNSGFLPGSASFVNNKAIVSPGVSVGKLEEALKGERDLIHSSIKSRYALIDELYTFRSERLYGSGEWCGVVLESRDTDGLASDDIRFILNKQNNTWKVLNTPLPYLTTYNTQGNTPIDILKSINDL